MGRFLKIWEGTIRYVELPQGTGRSRKQRRGPASKGEATQDMGRSRKGL